MSLNESRSGEMRMDFITFVSWVLTVMLISTIISPKIDVYVGMFTVRVRVSVFSPLKVVLLQVVRVRARCIRDYQLKVFFFFTFFNYGGVGAGRCLSCRRVNPG